MLSLVIPGFSVTEELMIATLRCIGSFRPYIDEIILSDDSDSYWDELHDAVDIYAIHPRVGYTKNLNIGWRLATGDYVLHTSADCELLSGNPRDLCMDGFVVSPKVMALDSDPPRGNLSGACFVVPKTVTVGMMSEDVDWDHNPDLEYFGRLRSHNIPTYVNQDVIVKHAAASPGPFMLARDQYSGR